MSQGFVDVSYKAFDECRTQINIAAKKIDVDDILKVGKSKPPATQTDGSKLFGKLNDAAELAAQMDGTWSAIRNEIESGRLKLESVERALDAVETNLRKAETASGA
ncbi:MULTISPECIES: hypothetical protein [unclassified Nonomuraea]|uniref:hypothetical protein n=1 Tax=unclassified Nonomuraea TaxID=2593643 RepID=UPI0033E36386